ncbi:hypothetical protein A0H81_12162 [Grifola frondosa]|uniref:DUF6533 domain-containing protein n=1 Tax=Grifola frondosa TaxID=5627 RepID=A0A1C7LSU5_GRIFR|nr:hypothetical protein A0H81_12162 [Grifola frondosa]
MADSISPQEYSTDWYETSIVLMLYVSATALFCYDYFLTLGSEVEHIWRTKISIATLVFYAVRYSALFSTIFVILDIIPGRDMTMEVRVFNQTTSTVFNSEYISCTVYVRIEMGMNFVLLCGAATFSALRAYALWGRNKWVLIFTLALGLVNPAISLYQYIINIPGVNTFTIESCGVVSQQPAEITEESAYIYVGYFGARASSVVADAAVLGLTWAKTFRMRAEAMECGIRTTFAAILMRDGTMYFLILLVINIAGLVMNRPFNGSYIYAMSTWIAIITAIMMCRFMLHLHEADSNISGDSMGYAITTIVFRNATCVEHDDITGTIYSTVELRRTVDDPNFADDGPEGIDVAESTLPRDALSIQV